MVNLYQVTSLPFCKGDCLIKVCLYHFCLNYDEEKPLKETFQLGLKASIYFFFSGYRENNFPPLPSRCPCKPCFFHDIGIDIPIEYQKTCRALFIRWQGKNALYYINFQKISIKGTQTFLQKNTYKYKQINILFRQHTV